MKWNPIANILKEKARDRRRSTFPARPSQKQTRVWHTLRAGLLLPLAILPAQAQELASPPPRGTQTETDGTRLNKPGADAAHLENVVVSGGDSSPRTVAAEAAATQLAEVPGGASVVSSQDVERARASSTADVLRDQPGVFAQQAGGNDAIKISIRGSGINRGTGFFRSGVKFTYDGLPVTGPSGTPFELLEPLGLQYTEVLRGGNAFDRGALALGGAINFVTNTGYEAFPIQARVEAGSFGYFKGQVSSGLVEGPLRLLHQPDEFHPRTDSRIIPTRTRPAPPRTSATRLRPIWTRAFTSDSVTSTSSSPARSPGRRSTLTRPRPTPPTNCSTPRAPNPAPS